MLYFSFFLLHGGTVCHKASSRDWIMLNHRRRRQTIPRTVDFPKLAINNVQAYLLFSTTAVPLFCGVGLVVD